MKKFLIILILINFNILHASEIIRDHIVEHYLKNIISDITNTDLNFRLFNDNNSNAFIIDNNHIFLTKGLFNIINDESALISIMLHEYGHIKKNHLFQKKKKISEVTGLNRYTNIFSAIVGISMSNSDIFFGSTLTLNEVLIQDLLKNSREYEEEADNIMLLYMKKNNINKNSTINFLKYLEQSSPNNKYRASHPSIKSRINKLKKINYKMKDNENNSNEFEFLLAKYYRKSNIQIYNNFFSSIDTGKYYDIKNDEMAVASKYEIFKKGIEIANIDSIYEKNILKYDNSYMKLEYLNYLLSNGN
ncbi:M48 family metalloprotease, partial [Alphaproteobacteria bacterium]|nr:M48 family metalloprotease [Alphaproteobacteria bacterium]